MTDDPHWYEWSTHQLEIAALHGGIAVNEIVYAEASVRSSTIEAFERMLNQAGCGVIGMPRSALFMAGRIFQRYRASGGMRTGVPPDFFIGAHAAIAKLPLPSRDTKRLRTYFPTVELITPYAA